jgi:hypothetical protein
VSPETGRKRKKDKKRKEKGKERKEKGKEKRRKREAKREAVLLTCHWPDACGSNSERRCPCEGSEVVHFLTPQCQSWRRGHEFYAPFFAASPLPLLPQDR